MSRYGEAERGPGCRRHRWPETAAPPDSIGTTKMVTMRTETTVHLLLRHSQLPRILTLPDKEMTGGMEKTSLAVHWGHRQAGWFPDGSLYLNLRGYDPAGVVMSPRDASRVLLDAFDVPAGRIPVDLDAQLGLYRPPRGRLADHRRAAACLGNGLSLRSPTERPSGRGRQGCHPTPNCPNTTATGRSDGLTGRRLSAVADQTRLSEGGVKRLRQCGMLVFEAVVPQCLGQDTKAGENLIAELSVQDPQRMSRDPEDSRTV